MVAEKNYLIDKLKVAGVRGTMHTTMKSLKNCNLSHVGAVLRMNEEFTHSGSKKIYGDQEGRQRMRRKLFDRKTSLRVVIADSDEAKCEAILERFLKEVGKGLCVDGNWVGLEVKDVEWLEDEDSILKAKIATQFVVEFTGGIYQDNDMKQLKLEEIEAEVTDD